MDREEKWLPVVGYEDIYEVSDLGRVRSLTRKRAAGHGTRIWHSKILKSNLTYNGYYSYNLSNASKNKYKEGHVLVAESFLGHKVGAGLVVNHINRIRTDNRLENLEIVTVRYNSSCHRENFKNGFTGTFFNKLLKKYRAIIRFNRNRYSLGCFTFREDAAEAYRKALHEFETNGRVPKRNKRKPKQHAPNPSH